MTTKYCWKLITLVGGQMTQKFISSRSTTALDFSHTLWRQRSSPPLPGHHSMHFMHRPHDTLHFYKWLQLEPSAAYLWVSSVKAQQKVQKAPWKPLWNIRGIEERGDKKRRQKIKIFSFPSEKHLTFIYTVHIYCI